MQQGSVALRERSRLAALVHCVLRQARRQAGWQEPDRRNLRTWRQLVLGLVVARSTRLVTVGQAVLGQRAAQSVKAVAMAFGYFLTTARFPAATVSTLVLEATIRQLDPAQVATYRGKVVVALDPTDYPKRSRGTSTQGRHMEHVGRVRKPVKGGNGRRQMHRHHGRGQRAGRAEQTERAGRAQGVPKDTENTAMRTPGATAVAGATVATTSGYVDVWAGLVLTGRQLLPLARALFSNRHPTLLSQNKIEEAVLAAVWAVLERLGWAAILVADRGLGRKELLVALTKQHRDFVIRVDADVTAFTAAQPDGALLGAMFAAQPVVGAVIWDRGQEGTLRCEARAVTATIRFSRTGRQGEYVEATLQFIELLPLNGVTDPLVLATTLPVPTLPPSPTSRAWSVSTRGGGPSRPPSKP